MYAGRSEFCASSAAASRRFEEKFQLLLQLTFHECSLRLTNKGNKLVLTISCNKVITQDWLSGLRSDIGGFRLILRLLPKLGIPHAFPPFYPKGEPTVTTNVAQ